MRIGRESDLEAMAISFSLQPGFWHLPWRRQEVGSGIREAISLEILLKMARMDLTVSCTERRASMVDGCAPKKEEAPGTGQNVEPAPEGEPCSS